MVSCHCECGTARDNEGLVSHARKPLGRKGFTENFEWCGTVGHLHTLYIRIIFGTGH